MTQTPLDRAWSDLNADPDDTAKRLRYFERVMDAELFMVLDGADGDDTVTPKAQIIEGTEYVLAFDLESRLAEFSGTTAEYLTVSGRGLIEMLLGQGAGILLNPRSDSENTVPPDTVTWLAQMAGVTPDEVDDSPEELLPPAGVDEGLILALDAKFSTMRGLADHAVLVLARYADGRTQPLVGIFDARDGAEPDMARAITEAAQFSGAAVDAVDLVFLPSDHPVAGRMAGLGLKFQIPRSEVQLERPAPGSDPAKPPRLH